VIEQSSHAERSEPSDSEREVLIRTDGIGKSYRGVHALKDMDFELLAGEIHALVGENGAGKSTLCKIIAGAVPHDTGDLFVAGETTQFSSPADALHHGIAMVYQETSLVPTMTVAQNIDLGHEKLFTRYRSLNIEAQTYLQSMNFQVDPAAYVSTLGTAKRQMVEITRALRADARVIIFDEPTASLSPEETWYLFNVMDDLRRRGLGVIFVTHALEEALGIADRITVLRDGSKQHTGPADDLTKNELVRHMVGREVGVVAAPPKRDTDTTETSAKEPVLRVENVTMGTVVKNMSFSAYAGEILGIFGLIGAGRTETAKIVTGALKRNRIQGGTIYLRGRKIRYRVPKQAIDDGIAYVTEDRKTAGFFETMTISDNIYLAHLATRRGRKFTFSRRASQRVGADWMKRLRIAAIHPNSRVVELSGGNQQKVTLAKSLVQSPDVVIFDEPTRGVDVGAIEEIHTFIRELAAEGKTVIVISSYLPELRTLSDRIAVARLGRVVAEFAPEDATDEAIMYAAVY
jgi:simple sugar transport system ATP-binding protein